MGGRRIEDEDPPLPPGLESPARRSGRKVMFAEHGTEAAIARHDRAGEPMCDECEENASRVWAEKNARQRRPKPPSVATT